MGAVRGTPVLFWFLGFRCWVIGDRKREEYSRWKGNGNNQGGKEWTHGVFFWGEASSAHSWCFFSPCFEPYVRKPSGQMLIASLFTKGDRALAQDLQP